MHFFSFDAVSVYLHPLLLPSFPPSQPPSPSSPARRARQNDTHISPPLKYDSIPSFPPSLLPTRKIRAMSSLRVSTEYSPRQEHQGRVIIATLAIGSGSTHVKFFTAGDAIVVSARRVRLLERVACSLYVRIVINSISSTSKVSENASQPKNQQSTINNQKSHVRRKHTRWAVLPLSLDWWCHVLLFTQMAQ